MQESRFLAALGALTIFFALGMVAQSPAPSYERDVQPIFKHECVKCHDAKEHKGKLDLSGGTAYQNLVKVPSREEEGVLRVKPGDPEGSYLWQKLMHETKEGSGMPKGIFFARKLDAKDLDLIRAWIASGAQP